MKKLLILTATLVATVGALAQGTINFSNGAAGVNAPIRDAAGALLAGTSFVAQLWAGPNATSLAPITPTATFGTGATAGYFFGGARTIGTVATGSQAYFQVRVWAAAAGADWATASTTVGAQVGGDRVTLNGAALGPYQSAALGGGALTPPNLVGLQSFNLYVVPEPGTIALGALGLAGLLFIRRRK